MGALSAAAATVGAVQLTARPLKALLCAIAATTQNPHGQQDQALAFVQQQQRQQQRAQRRQKRQVGARGTAMVLPPSSSSPALLRAPTGAAPARAAAPVPSGPLGLGAALHCSLL